MIKIPDYKRINVIIDTDAACEADDPFAIVQALLSPKLIVKGIVAEHFNEEGSVQRSYREIETILDAMGVKVSIFMGEEKALKVTDTDIDYTTGTDYENRVLKRDCSDEKTSEGVDFIIEEALREEKTYILCQGAITNVAAAFRKCPEIIKKVTVIWIGTHGGGEVKAPFREFNAGNDIVAANEVLSSGTDLWLVPSDVYTTINVGLAELKLKVYPYGEIGKHLYENMIEYNMSPNAGWTKGESWSLGDSPAIALALNPDCGKYVYETAPYINEDTSSSVKSDNPVIRIYKNVDSRYILEDFFAKLQLNYPKRA